MKRFLILCAFAIPLAACSEADVKNVQAKAVTTCGYLPTAQTVANIAKVLYASSAIVIDAASDIANKICNAVTTNPMADGPGKSVNYVPQVAGVPVKGKFVK